MTLKSALLRACAFLFLITVLACAASPARADGTIVDPAFDGKTHLDFTPYLWLPTLNGQFKYDLSQIQNQLPDVNDRYANVTIGPNNYLSNVNFALAFNGQLRKGKWAVITDFLNVNASGQGSQVTSFTGPFGNHEFTVSGSASNTAVSTLWEIAPSYTVFQAGRTNVNVLLGGRFMWLKGSIEFNLHGGLNRFPINGSAQRNVTLENAILGTYGAYGIGKHWAIPFYLDIGTGTPEFSSEAALGARYGNLALTYRYLYLQGSGDELVQNVRLNGPQLGYTFHF